LQNKTPDLHQKFIFAASSIKNTARKGLIEASGKHYSELSLSLYLKNPALTAARAKQPTMSCCRIRMKYIASEL
jgi:hypothetical protein